MIVSSFSPGSTVNVSWAGPVTVIVAPRRATWTLGSSMSNSIVVFPIRKKRTTAASAAMGAMAAITHRSLPLLAGGTCAEPAAESRTIAVSSCDAAESDAKRSAGFLASIFRQTASIRGSRPGRNLPGGVGCRERICNQMVGEGLTLVAAAGDQGSTPGCGDGNGVIYPSSDPDFVAAGGTALKLNYDGTWLSGSA